MNSVKEIVSSLLRNGLVVTLAVLYVGCDGKQEQKQEQEHSHAADQTYTCPMHPSVVQEKPGSCPVCGMDLVQVSKSDAIKKYIMLSDAQMKLANISVARVKKSLFGQSSTTNGRLALDKERSEVISSRVAGRIEKLFIKENGQYITKGQPLYTIYSETLLTLQQEYVLAEEQYKALGQTEKRYKSFRDAAEKKLLLYGLTEDQISALVNKSVPTPQITFFSPASGIVSEISVTEGQYVAEGSSLFTLEDLKTLWVEAELFPDETSRMRVGDKIRVRVGGNGGETIEAKVSFLSPELRANTQIIVMRASIDNPSLRYKPGQQANIYLSHSEKERLTVPVDAVIRNEKGAHLYVQNGRNTFEPRMVQTGIEDYRDVEIKSGIVEGDTVAISGAYLLYSEMILKKGTDPMAGHAH